jgi:hypothetical protein
MSLTDTAIRQAKPQAKPIKMFDERKKSLSLGIYPDVPLTLARDPLFDTSEVHWSRKGRAAHVCRRR